MDTAVQRGLVTIEQPSERSFVANPNAATSTPSSQ